MNVTGGSQIGRIRRIAPVLSVALCIALGACTTQAWYDGMQSSQRQQCQKIDHREERKRCEQTASLPYEDYRAQTGAQTKP
ncbi:MAG: hypothetical protein ABIR94_13435 [Rubrivivax sp.]